MGELDLEQERWFYPLRAVALWRVGPALHLGTTAELALDMRAAGPKGMGSGELVLLGGDTDKGQALTSPPLSFDICGR